MAPAMVSVIALSIVKTTGTFALLQLVGGSATQHNNSILDFASVALRLNEIAGILSFQRVGKPNSRSHHDAIVDK
jgi:hypothetical protein